MHTARSLLWLVLVTTVFTPGCTPREGRHCQGNVAKCTSAQEALWCSEGRYVSIPCRGAAGCSEAGGSIYCDQSAGQVHDRCLANEARQGACSVDHTALLRCNGHDMALVADCDGPSHCTATPAPTPANPHATALRCDESTSAAGEPCEGTDDACSMDHSQMMGCVQNRWAPVAACKGAAHCHIEGTRVLCDESIADIGDHCGADGGVACTPDGARVLFCRAHSMVAGGECAGAGHCHFVGTGGFCDGPMIAVVGAACHNQPACTADRRQTLRCDGGSFVAAGVCEEGTACGATGNGVACQRASGEAHAGHHGHHHHGD